MQLKKYYKTVELVTDTLGKEILINKLKLPYTNVALELDKIGDCNMGLWALGKILAYSIQSDPFLHVDNDVFIWKKFDEKIARAELIAQNRELSTVYNTESFYFVLRNCSYIPPFLNGIENFRFITGANAGILGGRDVDFFQIYTTEIQKFLDENVSFINSNLKRVPESLFNVFFEQVIFYTLAKERGQEVTYLFPEASDNPEGLGYFHEAHNNQEFVHTYSHFKRNRIVYSLMEIKVRSLYPEYYNRVMELISTYEL